MQFRHFDIGFSNPSSLTIKYSPLEKGWPFNESFIPRLSNQRLSNNKTKVTIHRKKSLPKIADSVNRLLLFCKRSRELTSNILYEIYFCKPPARFFLRHLACKTKAISCTTSYKQAQASTTKDPLKCV